MSTSRASDIAPDAIDDAHNNVDQSVPFTLRVAAQWLATDDAPHGDDGQYLFSQRAPLTGQIATTGSGQDVAFSDLEL